MDADNIRHPDGRFRKGNPGGPGSPLSGKIAKLRAALVRSCSVQDIKQIAETLKRNAKDGDMNACKELLNRTLGKPLESDILERIEALEEKLSEDQK